MQSTPYQPTIAQNLNPLGPQESSQKITLDRLWSCAVWSRNPRFRTWLMVVWARDWTKKKKENYFHQPTWVGMYIFQEISNVSQIAHNVSQRSIHTLRDVPPKMLEASSQCFTKALLYLVKPLHILRDVMTKISTLSLYCTIDPRCEVWPHQQHSRPQIHLRVKSHLPVHPLSHKTTAKWTQTSQWAKIQMG